LAPLRKNALSIIRGGIGRRRILKPVRGCRAPIVAGRRQGSVVGAIAHRTRLRGQVRSSSGDRFRHATQFIRWRPDRRPADCRYDQLEVTTPYELEKVFGVSNPGG
jgi:ATP-dependent DNA ligase